jgi:hypothetical protein
MDSRLRGNDNGASEGIRFRGNDNGVREGFGFAGMVKRTGAIRPYNIWIGNVVVEKDIEKTDG